MADQMSIDGATVVKAPYSRLWKHGAFLRAAGLSGEYSMDNEERIMLKEMKAGIRRNGSGGSVLVRFGGTRQIMRE